MHQIEAEFKMSEETTSLTKAAGGTKSLRTTVPIFIVKLLKLQEGDQLQWKADITSKGEVNIQVKPLKKK
jgi:hypothetical protein